VRLPLVEEALVGAGLRRSREVSARSGEASRGLERSRGASRGLGEVSRNLKRRRPPPATPNPSPGGGGWRDALAPFP